MRPLSKTSAMPEDREVLHVPVRTNFGGRAGGTPRSQIELNPASGLEAMVTVGTSSRPRRTTNNRRQHGRDSGAPTLLPGPLAYPRSLLPMPDEKRWGLLAFLDIGGPAPNRIWLFSAAGGGVATRELSAIGGRPLYYAMTWRSGLRTPNPRSGEIKHRHRVPWQRFFPQTMGASKLCQRGRPSATHYFFGPPT